MSNINKTSQELKKKLSFEDYAKPSSQQDVKPARRVEEKKIKATYYHTQEEYDALLEVYIKRLKSNKTDKSALIGEAIKLLVERELS